MATDHEHTFAEEREPSGRLIAVPCLECGLSAFDAMTQAKKESVEDKLRIKDLIFWADKAEAHCDTLHADLARCREALVEAEKTIKLQAAALEVWKSGKATKTWVPNE